MTTTPSAILRSEPDHTDDDGQSVWRFALMKPDLALPSRISGSVTLAEMEHRYEVKLAMTDTRAGYALNELTIGSDGRITTAQIHKLSLPSILHALASADPFVVIGTMSETAERTERTTASSVDRSKWEDLAAQQERGSGPSEEVLLWAARTYAWFRAVGGNPIRGVQESLGVSSRTASRWIAKARDLGLLDG